MLHVEGRYNDPTMLPSGSMCDNNSCLDSMSEKSVVSKLVPEKSVKGMTMVGNLMLSIDGVLSAPPGSEERVKECGPLTSVHSCDGEVVVADPANGVEGSSTVLAHVALCPSVCNGSMP